MPFIPSFLAGLSAKGAAGLAVAAIAVGGGTAATVATHSMDPVTWAQVFVGQVKTCQSQFPGGHLATPTGSTTAKENVGQCVSGFAKKHGQAEHALHANGAQGGNPKGLSSSHSTGRPANLPAAAGSGKPNGLPTSKGKGRPNSNPSGH